MQWTEVDATCQAPQDHPLNQGHGGGARLLFGGPHTPDLALPARWAGHPSLSRTWSTRGLRLRLSQSVSACTLLFIKYFEYLFTENLEK